LVEQMPAAVRAEVDVLKAAARHVVTRRTPSNLLIGSWNLRAFGGIADTWAARDSDTPKRDWRAVALIASVVRAFDVIAIQELRRSPKALFALLAALGPEWRAITSDVSEGDPGNDERLGFVYNSTRVQPGGLVGEVVLPTPLQGAGGQFARTPYAASFVRNGVEFTLVTVHILWGDTAKDRRPELQAFATWMRDWAERKGDWNSNLLVLGDFNVDRHDSILFTDLMATGMWPPTKLNTVPRTIFDNDKVHHFYDQIAWFADLDPDAPTTYLNGLSYHDRAGHVDFVPHAFAERTKNELSWRISDHYPLWVEFVVDSSSARRRPN
jgi:hypothetical protein